MNKYKYTVKEITQMLNQGYDTFEYYLKGDMPNFGKKILSPLRDEGDPSFSLFVNENNNEIYYKDQGSGSFGGNHLTFVMELFGIDFLTALKKVKADVLNKDGSMSEMETVISFNQRVFKPKDKSVIKPHKRELEQYDLDFWGQFQITPQILEDYNVYPISYYDLKTDEGKEFEIHKSQSDPSYAIEFPSGNYKIYSPLNKKFKWVSNTDAEKDVFGWNLLPKKCKNIFLLAGNKDVMSFKATTGLDAIALNSETSKLSFERMNTLQIVTDNIYVFYDNDKQGIKQAEKFKELYGFKSFNHLLAPFDVNDYSELVSTRPDNVDWFRDFFCALP